MTGDPLACGVGGGANDGVAARVVTHDAAGRGRTGAAKGVEKHVLPVTFEAGDADELTRADLNVDRLAAEPGACGGMQH